MPRIVTIDGLKLEGASIWVNFETGEIKIEQNYALLSASEVIQRKSREVSQMLDASDKAAILQLAQKVRSALEQQEMT